MRAALLQAGRAAVDPGQGSHSHTRPSWLALVARTEHSGSGEPHSRRAMVTAMGDLGVARETIRRVLNHQERDVTATYERSKHLREMRQALEAWARRLHAIVTGEASAKVIPLVRA